MHTWSIYCKCFNHENNANHHLMDCSAANGVVWVCVCVCVGGCGVSLQEVHCCVHSSTSLHCGRISTLWGVGVSL